VGIRSDVPLGAHILGTWNQIRLGLETGHPKLRSSSSRKREKAANSTNTEEFSLFLTCANCNCPQPYFGRLPNLIAIIAHSILRSSAVDFRLFKIACKFLSVTVECSKFGTFLPRTVQSTQLVAMSIYSSQQSSRSNKNLLKHSFLFNSLPLNMSRGGQLPCREQTQTIQTRKLAEKSISRHLNFICPKSHDL
jgi:hypothetical protein